jgi:hypothetical protein
VREPEPDFDRQEAIVCMVLAFFIGNALISVVSRMMA